MFLCNFTLEKAELKRQLEEEMRAELEENEREMEEMRKSYEEKLKAAKESGDVSINQEQYLLCF